MIFFCIFIGNKTNAQFIIENPNVDHLKKKRRFRHPRDLKGSYGPASTEYIAFVMDSEGILNRTKVEVNGQLLYKFPLMELDPTGEKKLFSFYRLSYQHKTAPLSKNIFYFLECPHEYARVKERVFVSYLGTDNIEESLAHGNSRNKSKPYLAPGAKTMNKMEDMVDENKGAMEILAVLGDSNKPQGSLQSLGQIHSLKSRLKKHEKEITGNESDQLIRILGGHHLGSLLI